MRKQSIKDLETIERKSIAGTLGKKEQQSSGIGWGWFGSMFGFGVFKNTINANAPKISEALDCIPLTGPVVQTDYENFVRNFLEAFEGKDRKAGIAPASRLLAMKRPDYFVCFDQANKAGLSARFGVAASAVNLETYWTNLIEPITYSQWWRTSRPRGIEGRIWDGRAAFLDAIYYKVAT